MTRSSTFRLTAVALLLLVFLPAYALSAVDARSYVQARYALELDGVLAGYLFTSEGGGATSDVVNEKLGPDHVIRKHLAGVKYQDITVTCGTGMTKQFYQWIADTLDSKYSRKNGAILYLDYRGTVIKRLNFQNALISEVGFPALDAGSRDAAVLTVKFKPEITRMEAGGAKTAAVPSQKQEKWLQSNFRLTIGGLDTSKTSKIGPLIFKQKVIEHAVGEIRDYQQEPAFLEVPNLLIEIPEASGRTYADWHNDFVIRGNNGQDREKSGTLDFLGPNLTPLFTLSLKNLGIFRLDPVKQQAGAEGVSRMQAEMYMESAQFLPSGKQ